MWEELWLGEFEFWDFTIFFCKIRCMRSWAFFSVRILGLHRVSVLVVYMNFRRCPWFGSGIRWVCHCRNRSSAWSAWLLIFKTPAVWNFWSVHAAFLVTWSPQPFSILLGRIRVTRKVWAMLFIMTQETTNIAKRGSLSYLKFTQVFSPSRLRILPPRRRGLLRGISTLILRNLACSVSHIRLSVSR